MKRLLWLAAAVALGAAAVAAPAPDPVAEPVFFDDVVTDVSAAFAGVWYCPRAEATLELDTVLTVAATEAATAALTFPNPVPTEEPDRARFSLSGTESVDVLVSDVALRGDSPGLVEFTVPQAAAFATTLSDEARHGDVCLDSVPKVWYLPGFSTQEGEQLELRLFNPFPEPAKLTVLAVSEIGVEPLPELQSVTVSARSWRDFDLATTLRFRNVLGLTLTPEEGLAFPSVLIGTGEDQASWPATRLADTWEFPLTRVGGAAPRLVVLNPDDQETTIAIDVFTPEAAEEDARTQTLPPATPVVVELEDLADGPMGVRLRASRPVAAAVVAGSGAGLAGTVGAEQPASRWLLPGVDPAGGASAVWLLNTDTADATVSVQPLIAGETAVKLIVPAGRLRQVLVDTGAPAYLVDAQSPVSAAWSGESAAGITYVAGAALQ